MGPAASTPDPRMLELGERLAGIAEELADLGIDHLRSALANHRVGSDGENVPTSALAIEKRITRARRAVEKAATLLRGPDLPLD